VIVAGNSSGTSSISNCESVSVQLQTGNPDGLQIAGYNLIILIGVITIISFIYRIKKKL
jgi:hypothetical protein